MPRGIRAQNLLVMRPGLYPCAATTALLRLLINTNQKSVPADRRVSDLADGPQEAAVAVLDLGVPLEALLDHLEDAEPLDLTAFKAATDETESKVEDQDGGVGLN